MYLIRKGEVERPICDGCYRVDRAARRRMSVELHLCRDCEAKLEKGPGVYIDPCLIRNRQNARERIAV